MKLCVINPSGNTGKSSTSYNLFAPKLGCAVLNIESLNLDPGHSDSVVFRGEQFLDVFSLIQVVDAVVVNVGAGHCERFLNRMNQVRDSHSEFDVFVVPIGPLEKHVRDGILVIEELARIGVPPHKIKVLFNNIEFELDLEVGMAALLSYHSAARTFTLIPEAVIHCNDVFPYLSERGLTLEALISDKNDYKALIAAEPPGSPKRHEYATRRGMCLLARGAQEELDLVFGLLFPTFRRREGAMDAKAPKSA